MIANTSPFLSNLKERFLLAEHVENGSFPPF